MIHRHYIALIERSFGFFPGVLLNGARQVGKSTLVEQLYRKGVVKTYITLDDLTTLTSCKQDPEGFLQQFETPVAIDEVQRCPELLVALKKAIDQNRKPGQYLLTGSANILSYPGVAESLAGRIDIMSLEGLSWSELQNKTEPSCFIRELFSTNSLQELAASWNARLQGGALLSRRDLSKLVLYGGFPEVALKSNEYFRSRWFGSYLSSYIERDVRDLKRLLDIIGFAKVFKLIGLQSGSLLQVNNLAVEAGLDQRTVSRYLEILELTFQIKLLQPYFANIRKRLVKTPKVYLSDSAYATYFSGIEDPNYLETHGNFGHLVETWLYGELRKLASLEVGIDIWFYRTHQGKEVDFILGKGDKLVAVEVKTSTSLQSSHLSGLKDFLSEHPHAFGILLYQGSDVRMMGSQILAVPLTIFNY